MCESIEQNNGRVELHVRRFQKRIFRVIRVSYRCVQGDMDGFSRLEPRAGKLARGVPRRGGDGNISSLFDNRDFEI